MNLKVCIPGVKFLLSLSLIFLLLFLSINGSYLKDFFTFIEPSFSIFKVLFHYGVIAFVLIFCAYELLPSFILNFFDKLALKLARFYERFDKTINLNDDKDNEKELNCLDSILNSILNTITLNKKTIEKVKIKKISHWFFKSIFLTLAFIVILFWDFFWHMVLKHFFLWIVSLRVYEKFSFYIQNRANKYLVLFYFILLFVIMEYFGIYSAVLIATGNILLAIVFYIAKFAMVFPVKILYKEGHDKLVAVPWFERRKNLLLGLLEWFETTSSFHKAKELISSLKNRIKEIYLKVKAIFVRIKTKFKRDKQYRFIFEFKAYRRLLRMRKKSRNTNAK